MDRNRVSIADVDIRSLCVGQNPILIRYRRSVSIDIAVSRCCPALISSCFNIDRISQAVAQNPFVFSVLYRKFPDLIILCFLNRTGMIRCLTSQLMWSSLYPPFNPNCSFYKIRCVWEMRESCILVAYELHSHTGLNFFLAQLLHRYFFPSSCEQADPLCPKLDTYHMLICAVSTW